MADVNPEDQKAFEAVQAEKAEAGIPTDEGSEKEEGADEERPEASEKNEEGKEEESGDEVEEESEEKSDDDAEDDAVEEESKEDEESDEDDDAPPEKISPKAYKDLKRGLKADYEKKLDAFKAEYAKNNPNSDKGKELEADVKALAKELNFDEDKTRKLIETARKGLEMTPEDRQFIKDQKEYFEKQKNVDFKREQESIFNGEWGAALPAIKAQYPNATEEQLAKAKTALDVISHSEKYHNLDMSDIVKIFGDKEFKYKDKDGKVQTLPPLSKTLFSPKNKSFESGRPTTAVDDDFDPSAPVNLSDMTPAQFAEFEKKREAHLSDGPRPKVKVTSRDDRGRIVEREE